MDGRSSSNKSKSSTVTTYTLGYSLNSVLEGFRLGNTAGWAGREK